MNSGKRDSIKFNKKRMLLMTDATEEKKQIINNGSGILNSK